MNKLGGITRDNCPSACSPTGCVIADGRPHCCHPRKGGVPANLKGNPATLNLYADACSALGVQNKHEVAQ